MNIEEVIVDKVNKEFDWETLESGGNYNSPVYDIIRKAVEEINVPKPGSVTEAVFVGEDNHHFLLDAKFKDYVRVPKTSEEKIFFSHANIGETLNVLVTSISDNREKEYSINGSVSTIYKEEAFDILKNIQDNQYVQVKVDKLTPAGYSCTISVNGCEIEAFLPQVLAGVNKIHDSAKEELVGQELEMCIESYADDKGTWIVSRRKYLKQLIPTFIGSLDMETEYMGHVTGSTSFGVFVEFNECLTGMIHKSNLTEDLKNNFREIKPGDEIRFKIKEIIKKKPYDKIILTQVETSSLWDDINDGQKLKGIIKEHKPFGTLVVLDHETLGLIHSSKQTESDKELKSGEVIDVKVLSVDRSQRKIYLKSM